MPDPFALYPSILDSPVTRAFAITPDDNNDLAIFTRGIYVGTSGDLKVLLVGDTVPVTYKGIATGVTHGKRIKRVYATGTDALDIVGEH